MENYNPAKLIELKSDDGTGDDPNAIVTKALDDLRTTVDERLNAVEAKAADFDKHGKRLDNLETKIARPAVSKGKVDDEQGAFEKKAFGIFLRKGHQALGADEVKSLRVADDSSGGYLAPAQFVAEVDKNIVQFSPIREAARVGSTASGSVLLPKRTGRPTASWVGETEARSSTESAYGQTEIPIDEITCFVDVSNRLLEDSAVNIEAEVGLDLAEEFGRAEGEAFVTGNGAKKPLGILNDPGLSYTPGGDAALIKADGLIDLYYALAPFYRTRGVWMCNGKTLATLRKLKDGQGNYLWQPGLAGGQPDTILGRPVVEAVDMPDIAANAFPVLFGDFASGFRVYDRVAFSLIRDNLTQATLGITRFHARRRVGARVTRSEAIRKLKIATA
ncbi:phage major capsid protein [Rhodoplanes roseus]|uniref:Phage major capsid protein n=1 Tax=Rhodoplanes roseus TaxID=29409 RepID=A0A327L0Q8_9BRAD|nr:phage major capsid protein [Rhodoplanes roseus]RAI43977.1 phage major capsid protein [Rhodoplanes roseus]